MKKHNLKKKKIKVFNLFMVLRIIIKNYLKIFEKKEKNKSK